MLVQARILLFIINSNNSFQHNPVSSLFLDTVPSFSIVSYFCQPYDNQLPSDAFRYLYRFM